MIKVSKFLSLILRHRPEVGGIELDVNGWTPISGVLAAVESNVGPFTREDLEALVRDNDKQRFIIDGDRIRANQGHSVEIDLGLQPSQPPAVLYHGTKTEFLPSIMREGLTKKTRQHVHLSADIETAERVAARRSGGSTIFEIKTEAMVGHVFYQSENRVWLTSDIPPQFLNII